MQKKSKSAGEGASAVCLLSARGQPESAEGHQPDDPALDPSPPQRQVAAKSGCGELYVTAMLPFAS